MTDLSRVLKTAVRVNTLAGPTGKINQPAKNQEVSRVSKIRWVWHPQNGEYTLNFWERSTVKTGTRQTWWIFPGLRFWRRGSRVKIADIQQKLSMFTSLQENSPKLEVSRRLWFLNPINDTTQWNWGQHTLIILSFWLPLEATAAGSPNPSIGWIGWREKCRNPLPWGSKNPGFHSVGDFPDFWRFNPNCWWLNCHSLLDKSQFLLVKSQFLKVKSKFWMVQFHNFWGLNPIFPCFTSINWRLKRFIARTLDRADLVFALRWPEGLRGGSEVRHAQCGYQVVSLYRHGQ